MENTHGCGGPLMFWYWQIHEPLMLLHAPTTPLIITMALEGVAPEHDAQGACACVVVDVDCVEAVVAVEVLVLCVVEVVEIGIR